jgi:hypothetical protein
MGSVFVTPTSATIITSDTAMLTSDYLVLLACLLCSGLLALALLSRFKLPQLLGYAGIVAVFTLHIYDSYVDYAWPQLLDHPSAVILKLFAVWGPLAALLIGLGRQLQRASDRRALHFIAVLIVGWGLFSVWRQLPLPALRSDTLWDGPIMVQSSESTCVAAAAATLLALQGKRISESEAARAGLISDNGGTVTQGWRILKLHAPGRDWYIDRLDRATVEANPDTWYLTSLRLDTFTGHAVVIRAAGHGRLRVLDPAGGDAEQDWAEFEPTWLRACAWSEGGAR